MHQNELPEPSKETYRPGRRGFMLTLSAAWLAVMGFAKIATAGAKKVAVDISKIDKLTKVGGSATVKIKGQDILLIRQGDKSFKALSGQCTHEACAVVYSAKDNKVQCPCHKSNFALDGKVLNGPATKNLPTYETSLEGNNLLIAMPDK